MTTSSGGSARNGIQKHPTGFRAFQRVHQGKGGLKSKVFPSGTPLSEIKTWREAIRVSHRQGPKVVPARGTLNADIARYLQLVATMPSLKDRTRDLMSWAIVYGGRPRHSLTSQDCRLLLNEWRLTGKKGKPLAASTVNHRRTALEHVYSVLDGKGAPNPLRDIPAFPEPPPEPRGVPMKEIRALLNSLDKTKMRARLKVLAWTGIRGRSELGKMRPEHVDLKRKVCWVPTGKHGKPRQLELNRDGVLAWKEFIALDAWGSYNKDNLRRTLSVGIKRRNAALTKQRRPLLPPLRVYDLRHSIATALLKAGADLADVQEHLGHTSGRMTRRYAPFVSAKLRSAMRKL